MWRKRAQTEATVCQKDLVSFVNLKVVRLLHSQPSKTCFYLLIHTKVFHMRLDGWAPLEHTQYTQ